MADGEERRGWINIVDSAGELSMRAGGGPWLASHRASHRIA